MLRMMSFSLLVGAAACFGLLYLKYNSVPPEKRDRLTPKQRLKTARLLIIALLALLAVGYRLESTSRALSGDKNHEPTWLERFALSR